MSKKYIITIPVGNLTEEEVEEFISLSKRCNIFKDIKVKEIKKIRLECESEGEFDWGYYTTRTD